MSIQTIQSLMQTAMEHQQAGRLAEAAAAYQEVLGEQPGHPAALHYLGLVNFQAGRLDDAYRLLDRAAQLAPLEPAFHFNLGLVLSAQERFEEAEGSLARAVNLKPDHSRAHHALGLVLRKRGQLDRARGAFAAAVATAPKFKQARMSLADALMSLGRFEEAIEHVNSIISDAPSDADAHNALGISLYQIGDSDGAMAAWERAIALRADHAQARVNLGMAFQQSNRIDDAIHQYTQTLRLHPDFAGAHNSLGSALLRQSCLDEAIEHYRKAALLKPEDAAFGSDLLCVLHLQPQISEEDLAREHAAWVDRHARLLMARIGPHDNDPSPERRLRLGYVSPDFRRHVVGQLIEPVLAQHDRTAFEIVRYSDHLRADDITGRIQSHADLWRNTTGLTDSDLAEQIRRDGIDILVDLTWHMSKNRLLMFAQKPAPVQVTYLGYIASTGLPTMDYRITDATIDPPGHLPFGPERLLRMPDCYWTYRPPHDAPEVQPPPVLRQGHATFGSFTNFMKVNAEVLALWGRILQQAPRSRLLLVVPGGEHGNRRLHDVLTRAGLNSDRVQLSPTLAYADYLRLYGEVDISLDPYPFNGGVTSLESLWMGVPLITLAGHRSSSRAGASILTCLKLTDLIARTPDEYIRNAIALAADSARLTELRLGLRERMKASPLLDEVRFTRNMEQAYRSVWREWCRRTSSPQL